MARPLRLEYAGAVYHVTARGNRKERIFETDMDRNKFFKILGRVCERFGWSVHAYCLMTNHYHLVVKTPRPNLSRGMQYLNGVYTQYFNRQHQRVGHVLQGRYGAQVVEVDAYLMELARYVVLNPVRANLVSDPKDYEWSSYRATIGQVAAHSWLNADVILEEFGRKRKVAIRRYIEFVGDGIRHPDRFPDKRELILGGEEFKVKAMDEAKVPDSVQQVSKRHLNNRRKSLEWYSCEYERNEAIYSAFSEGGYTLNEIGRFFQLHFTSVSRIVSRIRVRRGR